MDVRGSFSKLKKKFKRSGSKRDTDRKGVGSDGEKIDPASSLSPPVSHVVAAGGHNRGEGGAGLGERQTRPTDRPPPTDVSESVSARGRGSGKGKVEGGVGGEDVSQQRYLGPDLDSEVAMGSGPVREGDGEKAGRVDSLPSTPSILRSGKSDST